jgi:Subtilase family
MSMNMPKPVYWHKNQVAIRFHSAFKSSELPDKNKIKTDVQAFQDRLNAVVHKGTPFTLQRVGSASGPQAAASTELTVHDSGDLTGVYLFPSPPPPPGAIGLGHSDAVIFYDILPGGTSTASGTTGMSGMSNMSSMQGNGGSNAMGNDSTMDHTLDLVNYLRNYKSASQQANSSTYDAIPNWLWSGTDDVVHGCPVSPPIPVDANDAPGQWKISLQELSDPSLQNATGKGVTVFILDTLPAAKKISDAAKSAGNTNTLLQSMEAGMVSDGSSAATPPAIGLNHSFYVPDPSLSAMTGKDIYGQLVGFPMVDHGLCIAGIVRDLAPDANIECMRVLNDYGVGTLDTLINALQSIQARMEGGDLHQKPVVINLSLVVLPPGNDQDIQQRVPKDGDIMRSSLKTLIQAIQGLTVLGAVFVASAGNDSDPRDTAMNPTGERYWPRYPAYFAYDNDYNVSQIIPVGAVNQYGKASSYSNYPGPNGIATYAGETPTPVPPTPPQDATTQVTVEKPIDALRGVYCAGWYPQLTMGPMSSPSQYPMYQIPANNTWAYWTGTSFAVPVISALAARLLEARPTLSGGELRQAVLSTATQQAVWMGVASDNHASGPMIMAAQHWLTA